MGTEQQSRHNDVEMRVIGREDPLTGAARAEEADRRANVELSAALVQARSLSTPSANH